MIECTLSLFELDDPFISFTAEIRVQRLKTTICDTMSKLKIQWDQLAKPHLKGSQARGVTTV